MVGIADVCSPLRHRVNLILDLSLYRWTGVRNLKRYTRVEIWRKKEEHQRKLIIASSAKKNNKSLDSPFSVTSVFDFVTAFVLSSAAVYPRE